MRLVLVNASRGNRFMTEILDNIAFEARIAGVDSEVVEDVFPDDDEAVFVVIPHEYFAVVPVSSWPSPEKLSRTFALTVEHPGTAWFEISAQQARRCAAVIDINRDSSAELRRRGLSAELFQLGYSENFDVWRRSTSPRPKDIVYLGSTDPKRDRLLAMYSRQWWDKDVSLLIPGHDPKSAEGTDFITGRHKYGVLAETKALVNLHRDESRSLEWVRVLEAMANGCVVFSEHSVDASPLVAGLHFMSASPESVGIITANAVSNESFLADMRESAYAFITTSLRLSAAVEQLLDRAAMLLQYGAQVPEANTIDIPPGPGRRPPGWVEGAPPRDLMGEALARIETQMLAQSRALGRVSAEIDALRGTELEAVESASFAAAEPAVSVIIPVHNMSTVVLDAIESVRLSQGVSTEILLHDDASRDDSRRVIQQYIESHPELPISLHRSAVNLGVAATRNMLLDRSRGEFVFTLDADNGIYPTALARLTAALRADENASFAYSAIAAYRSGQPEYLISARSWDPTLFRFGNYIDNMALFRKSALSDLGGWDASLVNWEDFQLWLRFAEDGQRGVFVPQVLSWYRLAAHSRNQETYIHHAALWSRMRMVAPRVLHD